jgi:hypothetical protein
MGVTTYKRLAGPVSLAAAAANVWNNGSGGLIYDVVRLIHISNRTSAAATFSLWLGATGGSAAGTDLFLGETCPANDVYDWYPNMKMISTDFLTGLASAASTLTITIMGEQYVV